MPPKQHTRRFPEASMEHAFSIRRLRVSGSLAVIIQSIQSRRAIGVISVHRSRAFGEALRALCKSAGILGRNSLALK